MHSQTPYEITTLPAQPSSAYGEMLPHEIPPGVQLVTLPGGVRTLAYTQPPAAAAPQPVPVAQPIPTWAKTTALLAPTVGGGIAAASVGLSYAAPGLIAMSHALWSAVALIAAGAVVVPLVLRAARRPAAPAQITQNITATGLFGKATGTINHR
ncbi:hypothetical protein [Streptomyces griseoflavus]|uniref:Uncharacterized protein n=1 Tax=Streptomyces griseoflavus Tu4000 TaxID=467200 RepID=D9XWH8_9ACTN|nr:hypothetical protein [Streptomyces griseoflavus]EFL39752.1 hypothetical protein SSRG_02556 [Streptomyces griseoflavus Tu4000]